MSSRPTRDRVPAPRKPSSSLDSGAANTAYDAQRPPIKSEGWENGSSNIQVVVRCRPMSENEKKRKEEEVIQILEQKLVIAYDPGHQATNIMRQKRLVRERRFAFDASFGPSNTTEEVYEKTTKNLIEGVAEGYNSTCFAYGATGSGKTYTMLGTEENPGLMVLTLRDLYKEIAKKSVELKREYRVTLTYVEIYNEFIRDLLAPPSATGIEYLDLREDPIRGNTVAGVSEHEVVNTNEVLGLLTEGNKRRTQEPTAANSESSRSHAVLQIQVQFRELTGAKRTRIGKFSLIDLAGSERAANTKNTGVRLLEGANINRSLLALGNCINALVQGKGAFVPYRDSKLTRMLKDSLGGNCRTIMVAAISPSSLAFEETCNTLKYANRAKAIRVTLSAKSEAEIQAMAAAFAGAANQRGSSVPAPVTKPAARRSVGSEKYPPPRGRESKEPDRSSLPPARSRTQGVDVSDRSSSNPPLRPSPTAVASSSSKKPVEDDKISEYESLIVSLRNEVATLKKKLSEPSPEDEDDAPGADGQPAKRRPSAMLGASIRLGSGGYMSTPHKAGRPRVGTAGHLGRQDLSASIAAANAAMTLTTGGRNNAPLLPVSPSSPSSNSDAAENRPWDDNLVLPEGYILINEEEMAQAAEKLNNLRSALVSNFQERLQLRRSLMDLQTQNAENTKEVQRKQRRLAQLMKISGDLNPRSTNRNDPPPLSSPTGTGKTLVSNQSNIISVRREILELQNSITHNAQVRKELLARLEAVEKESSEVRDKLDTLCTTDEKRELLTLEYQVCLLELEKVELERVVHSTAALAKAKNDEVTRLRTSLSFAIDLLRKHGLGEFIGSNITNPLVTSEDPTEEGEEGLLYASTHSNNSVSGSRSGSGSADVASPYTPGLSNSTSSQYSSRGGVGDNGISSGGISSGGVNGGRSVTDTSSVLDARDVLLSESNSESKSTSRRLEFGLEGLGYANNNPNNGPANPGSHHNSHHNSHNDSPVSRYPRRNSVPPKNGSPQVPSTLGTSWGAGVAPDFMLNGVSAHVYSSQNGGSHHPGQVMLQKPSHVANNGNNALAAGPKDRRRSLHSPGDPMGPSGQEVVGVARSKADSLVGGDTVALDENIGNHTWLNRAITSMKRAVSRSKSKGSASKSGMGDLSFVSSNSADSSSPQPPNALPPSVHSNAHSNVNSPDMSWLHESKQSDRYDIQSKNDYGDNSNMAPSEEPPAVAHVKPGRRLFRSKL